jgi:hypothetical protein
MVEATALDSVSVFPFQYCFLLPLLVLYCLLSRTIPEKALMIYLALFCFSFLVFPLESLEAVNFLVFRNELARCHAR